MGVEGQLVEKSGSWFLYEGERLGQGRENAKAYLKHHTETADKLEKALRAKFLVGTAAMQAAAAEAEKADAITKAELDAAEKASATPAPAATKGAKAAR